MSIISSLKKIKQEIKDNKVHTEHEIIAVSKTFDYDHIKPLVDFGHKHFGENKVQEAEKKWKSLKVTNNDIKLHMIGRLQTNKAKKAVELFDYIHSVDNEKLANELSKRQKQVGRNLGYFIQINLGSEEQKGGVEIENLQNLYDHCVKNLNLSVLGLMAIPPNDKEPEEYFKKISELNVQFKLKELSIGMSSDYLQALKHGATFVRIGSAIFGNRN